MRSKNAAEVPYHVAEMGQAEIDYAELALRSGKTEGNGPYTSQVCQLLEHMTGAKKVLLTPSCTSALELAITLIDIAPGDEVIMPSFTFVSTANAVCLRGGVPVFVDILPTTLNIDPNQVEEVITDKTRAIMPVHYAGVACDMEPLLRLTEQYNLSLIEDAAQGVCSAYHEKPLGTFGRLGCFSFHQSKVFSCGEGGALLVNDPDLLERAEILREKGTNRMSFLRGEVDKYTWLDVGYSALASDILAAVLLAQLERRSSILKRRAELYVRYDDAFSSLFSATNVHGPIVPDSCQTNYHIYYLMVQSAKDAKGLIDHLGRKKIQAVRHYVPLHSAPYAKKLKINRRFPVTEDVSERLVRLPLYPTMTDDQQDRVVSEVYEFTRAR